MPNPIPGQSQDDFLKVCVPQVLQDGTAQNQQQAVAICISMFENAKDEISNSLGK